MIFETKRLLVRRYDWADLEDFYRLNSDPEVMKYIRAPKTKPQSVQFLQENIDYYTDFPSYGRWALLEKKTQEFIGSFMLRPSTLVSGQIEIGYSMFKTSWGKGYATEIVKGGLDLAFRQLQIQTVIAITDTANTVSQKVLLKCGFRLIENKEENGKIINLFSIDHHSHG
jgi:ribosomal-protein-alanine N-acetyltransferase